MSSPITFSGFNNIDFGSILTSLMTQASAPLTALQNKQTAIKTQSATIDALGSRLSTLEDAARSLGRISSLTAFAASSSDGAALGASAGPAATAGHYDVVVQEVARAQVTASAEVATTDTIVTTGGTMTIGGVDVTVSGAATLQDLASAINGTSGIGVSASVVRSSAAGYRLVLSSTTTGAQGAFTISNGLSGGAGVSFTDTDQNGVSGDSADDNAVAATDAQLLINNIQITSSSNTISDAIPGVTLTAVKKNPDAVIAVDLSPDTTNVGTQVASFVKSYNDFVKFAKDQMTAAANGDPSSIGRDPVLRQLWTRLRTMVGGAYAGGVFDRLSQAGIEFTQSGTLQLNQSVFTAALTSHPDDVKQLFAGANGAFSAIQGMVDEYSQAGGVLQSAKQQLTQQSASLDRQIASMQDRLAVQRATLQAEFAAADDAMSALKNQSSALTNFSASLSQFK